MINSYAQQPKRVALYAALAALVALLAYLALPFISITMLVSSASSYNSTSTQSIEVGAGVIGLFTGFICIEALLAVAVLCIGALLALREAPFGQGTMSVEVQRRRSAYAILILSVAAIIYQFLLVSIGTSQINSAIQNATASASTSSLASLFLRGTTVSVSLGYAVGSWIYLLAMLAVGGCGWLILRAEKPQVGLSQPQPSSLPWQQSGQVPQQSWQQPSRVYTPPSMQQGQSSSSSPQYYPPQPGMEQPSNGPYMPPYAQSWQQPPASTGDWHSPNN